MIEVVQSFNYLEIGIPNPHVWNKYLNKMKAGMAQYYELENKPMIGV